MPTASSPLFLSDFQWSLLQSLFPSASRLKGTPGSLRGRPAIDNRLILEIIFHKLTSRLPWYDLPTSSPSWQTVYQHYDRLQRTGAWKSILYTLLTDLNERGGLNLLTAIENRQIHVQRDGAGRLEINFPPHLEGTWQLTTATLLIQLLFLNINN